MLAVSFVMALVAALASAGLAVPAAVGEPLGEPVGPPSTTTTIPGATTTTTVGPLTTTSSTPDPTIPPGTGEPEPAGVTTTTEPVADPDLASYGELVPEERELLERYLALERDAQALVTQLAMVDGGLAAAQRELDDAARRVAAAERTQRRTQDQVTKVEADLADHRARLRVRAVQAYIGGSHARGGDQVMLQAATVDDLGKTLAYGAAVVEDEQSLVERTAELHARSDALRHEAEQDAQVADDARALVVQKQEGLRQEHERIIGAESAMARNSEAKLALLSDAAKSRVNIEAAYARTQALRDSISNTLAQRQVGQVPPLDGRGIFLSPIAHPRINSPFGPRTSPVLGASSSHPGIDINGRTGDPIRAPADGEVIAAGWIDGYGNCVIIDHGSALGTLYGHQSLIATKVGERVRRGQVIGFVGSTGFSTGPHLHWEVRILGQPVDPAPYVGDIT